MCMILYNAQLTLAYRNAETDITSWCENKRCSEEMFHLVAGSELLADPSTDIFFYSSGTIFTIYRMHKLKKV